MADYEVKITFKSNLSSDDSDFINEKLVSLCDELGMEVSQDGITYSKKKPYKKLEDIPAGVKFYFKAKKYINYFNRFEYYSHLEGDMNGVVIRRKVDTTIKRDI